MMTKGREVADNKDSLSHAHCRSVDQALKFLMGASQLGIELFKTWTIE
jgi:hypothetical protein